MTVKLTNKHQLDLLTKYHRWIFVPFIVGLLFAMDSSDAPLSATPTNLKHQRQFSLHVHRPQRTVHTKRLRLQSLASEFIGNPSPPVDIPPISLLIIAYLLIILDQP